MELEGHYRVHKSPLLVIILATWIQSKTSHHNSLRYNLILSSNLLLELPSGLSSLQCFWLEFFSHFSGLMRATCVAYRKYTCNAKTVAQFNLHCHLCRE
jgi:hypothetical protein